MARLPLLCEEGNSAPLLSLRRRHSLERQLLQSRCRLHDVEIALGIDINVMTRSEDTRRLGTADNLQRLAIENEDLVASTNIEELLIGIRRECEITGKRYVSPGDLLYELALFRKHLNATVFARSEERRVGKECTATCRS